MRYFILLAIVLLPAAASANCAAPVTYDIFVRGADVIICPFNFDDRGCEAGDKLLRTGGEDNPDPVLLDFECMPMTYPSEAMFEHLDNGTQPEVESGATPPSCYVDRCVEPGTWRYGFLTPYACHGMSCGTYYFQTATIASHDEACQAEKVGVTVYDGELPWGEKNRICGYANAGDGVEEEPWFACSPTWFAPMPLTVLGVNLVAVVLGLLLLRRRRHPVLTKH